MIVKIFLRLKINLGNTIKGFLEETGKEVDIYQMSTSTSPVLGTVPEIT